MSDELRHEAHTTCEYSGMGMEECPVAIGAWVDITRLVPDGGRDEIYGKWGRFCEHVDGCCAMVAGWQI